MESKIAVGLTTCDSNSEARELVDCLIRNKLIACGQVEGPITSTFWWDNKIQESNEWRVAVKFISLKAKDIQSVVEAMSKYETPQWVFWEVESSVGYTDWVKNPLS